MEALRSSAEGVRLRRDDRGAYGCGMWGRGVPLPTEGRGLGFSDKGWKTIDEKNMLQNICQSIFNCNCTERRAPDQGPRKVTKSGGVKERALMASAGARAYNGSLGAEPPAGPRGRAPGQGGEAPLKLKSFLLLDVHWKRQICPYSPCIADSVNYLNFQSNTDSEG